MGAGSLGGSLARATMAATMAGGSRKLKYEKMLEKKRHQRELEAVWKSNRRRPTPSTRRRPCDCVCSMAWRFHAIDAMLFT